MKKVISKIVLLTFVIAVAVVNNSCDTHFVRGNGILTNSEQSVSEFEKIHIYGCGDVHFYQSDEFRTVLTVDENLEKYVEIFVENNTLKIKTKHGTYRFTKFLVEVYCPSLSGVSISGSGNFEGMDKIITSTFDASISGSGDMKGDVECQNYSAKISGSGNMRGNVKCNDYSAKIEGSGDMRGEVVCQKFSSRIEGSGDMKFSGSSIDADIKIVGSGNFKCYDFSIKNANVTIDGSGDADVWVTDYLKAKIIGSGNINYRGTPQVESTVTGSGEIKKVN